MSRGGPQRPSDQTGSPSGANWLRLLAALAVLAAGVAAVVIAVLLVHSVLSA